VHLAFLGCGFITGVHSRHLSRLDRGGPDRALLSYASRSPARAEEFRDRYGGHRAYGDYASALADPGVDAVVVAVPPHLHLDLTRQAIAAGKHVLVEKPAFPRSQDYRRVIEDRDAAGVRVLVGENDHYKPLAVTLRRLLAEEAVGELVMASFASIADRPKDGADWRNDEALAGGDAFFEEGIHWLHVAGSLGPRIVRVSGHRPAPAAVERGGDRRRRSMVVAFDYDNGAVGALLYSREIPSLLRGLRMSKLYGRDGVISFESNGGVVLVRRRGVRGSRVVVPGWRDIRGYRAMYADFLDSIRTGRQPEMSIERALDDHLLMEQLDG
jgi:predicted dehydrogenase